MTRTRRPLFIVAALALAIGIATAAGATRPIFTDLSTFTPDAPAVLEAPDIEPEVVDRSDRIAAPSASLDAVKTDRLTPPEWPWFSDDVPTPEDALAGGAELVATMRQVPAIADLKILSAEGRVSTSGPDLETQFSWLKLNDNELLRIGTQLITEDLIIPIGPSVLSEYAGGQAAVDSKPGAIHTRLIVGGRMVLVDIQAVRGSDGKLSMTADDLLKIAADIIGLKS